ncbi:hypothetical protein Syun_003999 [Stephania yunnanensis]|uniref:Uncharacterized protein n=1 Tax=Stephania yunnanensis TaxID=152371 RepID=A0AAP0L3Q1_9MAGN
METKNCRRPKKSSRLSTREKSQLNQRIACSQPTQDTSSNAQVILSLYQLDYHMVLPNKAEHIRSKQSVNVHARGYKLKRGEDYWSDMVLVVGGWWLVIDLVHIPQLFKQDLIGIIMGRAPSTIIQKVMEEIPKTQIWMIIGWPSTLWFSYEDHRTFISNNRDIVSK